MSADFYSRFIPLVERRLEVIRGDIANAARQKDLATERELQQDAEVVGMVRQMETLSKALKQRGLMVQMGNDGALEAKLRPDAMLMHKAVIAAKEVSDTLVDEAQSDILSNPTAAATIVRDYSRGVMRIRVEGYLKSKDLMP